jgi:hypothetical protein
VAVTTAKRLRKEGFKKAVVHGAKIMAKEMHQKFLKRQKINEK